MFIYTLDGLNLMSQADRLGRVNSINPVYYALLIFTDQLTRKSSNHFMIFKGKRKIVSSFKRDISRNSHFYLNL